MADDQSFDLAGCLERVRKRDQAAARELEPDIRLLKLNSDVEQAVAARLRIAGIPTMILFQGGREIGRQSGALSASQIVQWVRRLVP